MSRQLIPHSGDRAIRVLSTEEELVDCARLLREAFATVARDFALTESMVPTNPAFTTPEKLFEYLKRTVELYGLYTGERLVGCVAIEPKRGNERACYIERLAVLPGMRHQGFGDKLLSHACQRIRDRGATTALIGLMDNHHVLKAWYKSKGFKQKECRSFGHLPFRVCFMSKNL
jgi:diamine N-acetyltransferase